jgi:Na+/phosphate symporter
MSATASMSGVASTSAASEASTMVEYFLVAMVLLLTSFGFYRLLRAQQEARRYLEGGSEAPLQLSHLSRALAMVARETRTLQISLESPLRAIREFMQTDLTRTEDDLEAIDAALMEVTREIGEWLAMIDALPQHERSALESMGASAGRVRAAMEAEGWAFERSHLRRPGRPDLDIRLETLMRELGRVETALQVPPNPYR